MLLLCYSSIQKRYESFSCYQQEKFLRKCLLSKIFPKFYFQVKLLFNFNIKNHSSLREGSSVQKGLRICAFSSKHSKNKRYGISYKAKGKFITCVHVCPYIHVCIFIIKRDISVDHSNTQTHTKILGKEATSTKPSKGGKKIQNNDSSKHFL